MNSEPFVRIAALLPALTRAEKLKLIELLARQLREAPVPAGDGLYGCWKGLIPEDLDLEATLREIRHEWLAELDAIGRGDAVIP